MSLVLYAVDVFLLILILLNISHRHSVPLSVARLFVRDKVLYVPNTAVRRLGSLGKDNVMQLSEINKLNIHGPVGAFVGRYTRLREQYLIHTLR